MSSDEVRDVIAGLREGDEVEADFDSDEGPYMIRGAVFGNPKYVGPKWLHHATAVRVIKRAPLPEPPAGTPVWFRGEWWLGMEQYNARPRYFRATDIGANDWRVWETMDGAVPAAEPGGDE